MSLPKHIVRVPGVNYDIAKLVDVVNYGVLALAGCLVFVPDVVQEDACHLNNLKPKLDLVL